MSEKENVHVAVRFRPLNQKEKDTDSCVNISQNTIEIHIPGLETHQFTFDNVFDGNTSQEKVFNTIAKKTVEFVSEGYNATIFTYGNTGCLDPETPILMYDGSIKPSKDIKLHDLLMGDDSTPRRVLKLFRGEDEMYDINSCYGETYRVNKSHVLSVLSGDSVLDIPVYEYLENPKSYQGILAKVEFPKQTINTDPYMTGFWCSKEQRIPKEYLLNSREIRLNLLAGILDRLGCYDNKIGYIIVHDHADFIQQIMFLARSLGFPARKNKEGCFLFNSYFEEIPVRIARTTFSQTQINYNLSIQHVGRGYYNGFMLDGNHRFLLGDFSVTHNSGKTFTMFGREDGDYEQRGIIPRTCDCLFQTLNNQTDAVEVGIRCSFLEIYQEKLRDLLDTQKKWAENLPVDYNPELHIRQNEKKGIYVQGLIEKFVYSPEDILEVIKDGAEQRSVTSTALNNVSSRSHAVLTIFVNKILSDGTESFGKLHLIDLAGSENVGKSEVQGIALNEAKMINKSLSSLGNVINALTESKRDHIPYRDSKLTYLLQDSLGGNSKTILITTASSSTMSYSETLNTLKFAKRAKEIKNAPIVNKNESNQNLIKTIELLKKKIIELENKCADSQVIIQAVEKAETDTKEVILVRTKCEQLEKNVQRVQSEFLKEQDRNKQIAEILEKQRELSLRISRKLYIETVRNCILKNELDQYKFLYRSLQDASTTDILGLILSRTKITDTKIDPNIVLFNETDADILE